MVTIVNIVEATQPGGVHGYKYLGIYESAGSIGGALETLAYIKNEPTNEYTESNLGMAREHLASGIQEFRERVAAVKDETLREQWLSALETVHEASA